MKIYALDTNIISFFMQNNEDVQRKFVETIDNGDNIIIPPIAYYEVKRGLLHKPTPKKEKLFEELCRVYKVVEMEKDCYDIAAEVYADTRKKGESIEDADILIASMCIANDYTLVTHNMKHFKDIDGLTVVDWCS